MTAGSEGKEVWKVWNKGQTEAGYRRCSWIVWIIIFIIAIQIPMESQAQPKEAPKADDIIEYTALGDSIAKGYCADPEEEIVGYPEQIAEELQGRNTKTVRFSNYARNGLTTAKLNATVLAETEVQNSIREAQLITVTIGANDLMNQFKKVSQEILKNDTRFHTANEALTALQEGIEANPFLLVKVVGAISGWDYDSFEEEWIQAMDTIDNCRREDTPVFVTTLYNPVGNMELPGTLNAVVESLIGKMNKIIADDAVQRGYEVIDLQESDIAEYTQDDGLHPSQAGQNLIKKLIEQQMDMEQIAGPSADEEQKRAEAEQARIEQEEADRAQRAADRQTLYIMIILLVNAALLWVVTFLYRNKDKKGKTYDD